MQLKVIHQGPGDGDDPEYYVSEIQLEITYTATGGGGGGSTAQEILRPNGNGNNIWDFHAYTLIDDVVEAPSTAGDSDLVVCDRSDDRVRGTWDMSAVTTLTSITSCRVHLRHKGDGYSDPVDVQLYVGGSWESAIPLSVTGSLAWVYADFSGSWSASDFDDALLGLTTDAMGAGDEYHLAVAYFELTGAAPSSSSKPELFSLFVDL